MDNFKRRASLNYLIQDEQLFEKRRKKFYGPNNNLPNPNPQSISIDLINESRMTGYYQTMKTMRALKEKGSLSIRKQKVEDDIKKYFVEHSGVDFGTNAFPKNTIDYKNPKTQIQSNALIIHGIHVMSRKSAVVYMKYFEPSGVIFLSISEMKIIFDTPQIAEKALYAYKHTSNLVARPSPPKFSYDPFRKGSELSKRVWHELIPYSVFGIELPLFGRFATNLDVKNQKQIQSGKYQRIRKLKLQLKQRGMNTDPNARVVFKDSTSLPPYFEDRFEKQMLEEEEDYFEEVEKQIENNLEVRKTSYEEKKTEIEKPLEKHDKVKYKSVSKPAAKKIPKKQVIVKRRIVTRSNRFARRQ